MLRPKRSVTNASLEGVNLKRRFRVALRGECQRVAAALRDAIRGERVGEPQLVPASTFIRRATHRATQRIWK